MLKVKRLDLYRLFRAGLTGYAVQEDGPFTFDVWSGVSKTDNVGRKTTSALLRQFFHHMKREFPGGAKVKGGKLHISRELAVFLRTHEQIGSTEEEAIEAWAAMQSIMENK